MNPAEVQNQDADVEVPPAWALTYADAALRCGLKAPEIEASLVSKGLPPSIAQSVVPYCFEKHFYEAKRSQIWADRLCWLYGVVFLLIPLGTWFPEAFGSFFRRIWFIGPYTTDPTPRGWIVFATWFFLLGLMLTVIVSFLMIMMVKQIK
jgi:hypothetical protein